MSSTPSTSPSGFLSSPRAQQRLLWISGLVLVAGVVVFLAIFLSRGSNPASTPASTVSSGPPKTNGLSTKAPKGQVKASPQAIGNARTFLETAVVRKNLGASYALVGPYLKGGLTRAQWMKGSIPPTFYPATNAATAPILINDSQPKSLILETVLKAKKSSHLKPQAFKLSLNLVHGKWLVTSFFAESAFNRKVNPNN